MNVQFRSSFVKDLRGLSDKRLKDRIKAAIAQVEAANTLQEIGDLKKLKGGRNYYRIRIGDYRIGLIFERGKRHVILIREDYFVLSFAAP